MTADTTGRLTDAQKRALDWLPADGAWKLNPGCLTAALNSLSFAWTGCIEHEWGAFGPNGGRVIRWRLNDRGIEIRKADANGR